MHCVALSQLGLRPRVCSGSDRVVPLGRELPLVDVRQLGERNVESVAELQEDAERRVDLSALDRADIVAVEIATKAEDLLRVAASSPQLSHRRPERSLLRARPA